MPPNNEELYFHLKKYYGTIFPSNLLCDWLSYGNDDIFAKREFSFTLADDIYIRYQSFANAAEFVDELKNKVPQKIDIGAVYNIKPKLNKSHGSGQMLPLWKEMVFDIDMTDYDDVRFCCGKETVKICEKCWTVMKVAVQIIDRVLREDFGFKHILWVYSGRRGVHGWVSDSEARDLDSIMRAGIVDYLTVVMASGKGKRVKLNDDQAEWRNKYHPAIVSSLKAVKKHFLKFLNDQCMLESNEGVERILQMLPNDCTEKKDMIRNKWANEDFGASVGCSEQRWRDLSLYLESENKGKVVDEIMLECLYPRLDANVSIGVNHLLKSPFCVHPGTGRICVPFLAKDVDKFDPFSVPTVEEVLADLDGDAANSRLAPFVDILRDFVAALSPL